ncbi:MAG: hypothetical protein HYR80_07005 [Nitrospirae bacterium]|nr:hypothetical protein [Nitrospirota bacterium]
MSKLRKYLAMFLIFATLGESLGGCVITYRNFPEEALHQHEFKKEDEKLYYTVQRFPILEAGGFNALKSAFRTNRMFSETINVEEPPEKGLYTSVEVKWEPLSLPSLIFGYLSVATFTLIPAYSGNEGFLVKFTFPG